MKEEKLGEVRTYFQSSGKPVSRASPVAPLALEAPTQVASKATGRRTAPKSSVPKVAAKAPVVQVTKEMSYAQVASKASGVKATSKASDVKAAPKAAVAQVALKTSLAQSASSVSAKASPVVDESKSKTALAKERHETNKAICAYLGELVDVAAKAETADVKDPLYERLERCSSRGLMSSDSHDVSTWMVPARTGELDGTHVWHARRGGDVMLYYVERDPTKLCTCCVSAGVCLRPTSLGSSRDHKCCRCNISGGQCLDQAGNKSAPAEAPNVPYTYIPAKAMLLWIGKNQGHPLGQKVLARKVPTRLAKRDKAVMKKTPLTPAYVDSSEPSSRAESPVRAKSPLPTTTPTPALPSSRPPTARPKPVASAVKTKPITDRVYISLPTRSSITRQASHFSSRPSSAAPDSLRPPSPVRGPSRTSASGQSSVKSHSRGSLPPVSASEDDHTDMMERFAGLERQFGLICDAVLGWKESSETRMANMEAEIGRLARLLQTEDEDDARKEWSGVRKRQSDSDSDDEDAVSSKRAKLMDEEDSSQASLNEEEDFESEEENQVLVVQDEEMQDDSAEYNNDMEIED
ncbi:hypothetical protein CYLTODRAFT_460336 [Cylindrobasidium torrendii FP15055 ss-10]|uniref:Uncharacterized protein n=1 Tax=Cylindrobasidium torrendii FP15055 ss-10 TaxID=1314674 RepID=A0A0D7AS86_9AGAR|nr:hypothetical protein CYLTODRAFT_460336 [Cylindrobasidium torrendii FP15055 ss-10]